jgi:flagellar export protein FliJ
MVKRFKYRLEKVLEYRTMLKDEKLKELLLQNKRLDQANHTLKELQAAILLNRLEENANLAVEQVGLIAQYSERLEAELEHQKIEVQNAEEAVNIAKSAYIEAHKEAEVLQRLKERKLEEHTAYILKEEEKFLDESVIQRTGFIKSKE